MPTLISISTQQRGKSYSKVPEPASLLGLGLVSLIGLGKGFSKKAKH
jgi:hypothetical protein